MENTQANAPGLSIGNSRARIFGPREGRISDAVLGHASHERLKIAQMKE